MSVLWMDDPSYYATAQIATRYTLTGGGSISVATGGRFGNGWNFSAASNILRPVTAIQTGTQAISLKMVNLPSNARQIIYFEDTGTVQCDLRVDPTGHLVVTRNGTTLATSTSVLIANVWYRIEFKLKVDPSAGTIEVHVNGSSTGWIPSTGSLNTRASTNSTFNQIAVGSGGNDLVVTINDWVFTDTNSPNADFLGDKRCFNRMPNSDSSVAWANNWAAWAASTAFALGNQIKDSNGNVQQCTQAGTTGSGSHPTWQTTGGLVTTDGTAKWTVVGSGANPGAHNWMAVSEIPEDGDNSYNSDSTPGDVDLFGLANLPAGAQNIAAISEILFCRKDDAGTRTIQGEISSSGTTANSASLTLSTSYQFLDFINETDPHTSAAWTVPGANALLVGYKEIA